MGVFRVEMEIGDPQGERYESVEAMVDSGASYTMIPGVAAPKFGGDSSEQWKLQARGRQPDRA